MLRFITKKDKFNFQDYCSKHATILFPKHSLKDLELEFKKFFQPKQLGIVDEENGQLRGILFIEIFSDYYLLKASYQQVEILDRLLMFAIWHLNKDLIIQLNDYKAVTIIKKHFFRFKEKNNNDYLYFRKYIKRVNPNVKL